MMGCWVAPLLLSARLSPIHSDVLLSWGSSSTLARVRPLLSGGLTLLPCQPTCLGNYSADGQSRVGHNFELLGAPVRDRAFMHDHTLQRARHAEPLLTAIAGLSDPQVGLRLLRACAGYARVLHSMRCTPSSFGIAWAGLGVQSAARHAPAAYLGSLAACQDACAELVPSLHPATFSHHGGNSLAALNAQLPTPIEAACLCPCCRSRRAAL